MELSALSENIVPVTWKRGGHTIELQVNIDALTPQFWRERKGLVETRLKAIEKEIKAIKAQKKKDSPNDAIKEQLDFLEAQASVLESGRDTNIDFLIPNILKGWDVTENGVPIPPTKEYLSRLPPPLVQDIFDTCAKAARTVKKTDDEEETQANTPAGSSGLRVVGQST